MHPEKQNGGDPHRAASGRREEMWRVRYLVVDTENSMDSTTGVALGC